MKGNLNKMRRINRFGRYQSRRMFEDEEMTDNMGKRFFTSDDNIDPIDPVDPELERSRNDRREFDPSYTDYEGSDEDDYNDTDESYRGYRSRSYGRLRNRRIHENYRRLNRLYEDDDQDQSDETTPPEVNYTRVPVITDVNPEPEPTSVRTDNPEDDEVQQSESYSRRFRRLHRSMDESRPTRVTRYRRRSEISEDNNDKHGVSRRRYRRIYEDEEPTSMENPVVDQNPSLVKDDNDYDTTPVVSDVATTTAELTPAQTARAVTERYRRMRMHEDTSEVTKKPVAPIDPDNSDKKPVSSEVTNKNDVTPPKETVSERLMRKYYK